MTLLVLSAVADGRRVLDTARERVVQLAQLAAEQQDDMVQEAGLLRVLARVPEVRLMTGANCNEFLASVMSGHLRINAVAVAGADGVVACSANPATKGMSISDRAYFQEALASQSVTVISAMTTSRVTKQPAVFFARQLERPPGSAAPLGVVIAGLDLEWFARLSNNAPALGEQLVQVLDGRDGAMLAQAPDTSRQIGQRFPDHPVISEFRAAPSGGSVQATGLDGVSRIFGFAPLSGHASDLVVAIGLREADIGAKADQRFWTSIAAAALAAGLAVLMGWRIAALTVLRPVGALMAVAAGRSG